ncbi:hypothetical protein F4810DRAFT_682761 [Camillea tinctor]|nr:hypothetical protein F4810DRAFT_682761 [Camillea tinctor]
MSSQSTMQMEQTYEVPEFATREEMIAFWSKEKQPVAEIHTNHSKPKTLAKELDKMFGKQNRQFYVEIRHDVFHVKACKKFNDTTLVKNCYKSEGRYEGLHERFLEKLDEQEALTDLVLREDKVQASVLRTPIPEHVALLQGKYTKVEGVGLYDVPKMHNTCNLRIMISEKCLIRTWTAEQVTSYIQQAQGTTDSIKVVCILRKGRSEC